MKELTKAEEQLMRIIWELKECSIKEVVAAIPEPKPAYNTVATVMKVLKNKGFIKHKPLGNILIYSPLIPEDHYRHFAFDKVISNYFQGSYKQVVSFLVEEKGMDSQEIADLLVLADQLKPKE